MGPLAGIIALLVYFKKLKTLFFAFFEVAELLQSLV